MELVNLVNIKIKNFLCLFKKTKKLNLFFTKDYFSDNKFHIGEFTYGNPEILFENDDANLTIGKFCSIAENVTIFLGGNHRLDWITTYPFSALNFQFPEASNVIGHPATKGDVIIGNDVWIGRGVVIMSGVRIEDGAVIAAGSYVVKNVGKYEVWGGNPAKMLKKRFSDEEIKLLCDLQWWNWDLNKIKMNVSVLCSKNFEIITSKLKE
jgi:acetyltransferase-like isoleucine patch superfamily enzyme